MILAIKYVAIALIAYLLGAIPFGLIIAAGWPMWISGNTAAAISGATNVFRTLGTKLGLITASARPFQSGAVGAAGYVHHRQ